jgi:hypothetical protein
MKGISLQPFQPEEFSKVKTNGYDVFSSAQVS